MSRLIKFDGMQVTMPLFDNSLLKSVEEMSVPAASDVRVFHYIAIKGGVPLRHCGTAKRLFAAGSIRTRVER